MTKSKKNEAHIRRLSEEIKGINTVMMTTIGTDGFLRSRPMASQHKDFDGTLYFFAHDNDDKISEIKNDNRVSLAYSAPSKSVWVSLSGKADLITDREIMKEYWHDELSDWFPRGLSEEGIILIKVNVYKGEFWDSTKGIFLQIVEYASVVSTGHEFNTIDHEQIDIEQ